MTTEPSADMLGEWMEFQGATAHDALRYRTAWKSAWKGRHDATVDCSYLQRRLVRALDQLDHAAELVIAIRAEHRLSAMAVDPHDGTTRYCSCGTRDCSTLAILQGRTDDA